MGDVPFLNLLAGLGHGVELGAEDGEGLSLGGGDVNHLRVLGIALGVAPGELAALGEFDLAPLLASASGHVGDLVAVACLGAGVVVAGGIDVGAVVEVSCVLSAVFEVVVSAVD